MLFEHDRHKGIRRAGPLMSRIRSKLGKKNSSKKGENTSLNVYDKSSIKQQKKGEKCMTLLLL